MRERSRDRRLLLSQIVVAACACVFTAAHAASPIQLRDVTGETGITFKHTDGSGGKRYIIEVMSAGVALFDYDRDGDADIYFLNGAPLEGTQVDVPPTNALYRNDGNFKFTDVTSQAGLGDTGFGLGVTVGDYDNDGDLDVYVNNYGPNVLYRNDGDGTFTDVTDEAGVANGYRVGAGTNFIDIDRDGDLDLFAANYVTWSYDVHVERYVGPWMVYPGPRDYLRGSNNLYRNNGNGTFTDISEESGIAAHVGAGMGTVAADCDNDGDTDLIVANDDWGNFLFQNDGTGKFTEVGLVSGIAHDMNGSAQSSMGVVCGDYNNDGWLDLQMTSYQTELATLYENLGGVFFNDVTRATGAGEGTLVDVTWGNGLVDFDNDGDRDLFIACGHLNDNVEKYSDLARYYAKNIVLMNTGDGKFVDVSDQCGNGLAVKLASRGAAFEDLDNDGDIDVVILNSRREPTILRNDSAGGNHWIEIDLRGAKSNRDGVGAQVKVVAGDLTQMGEVHSGQGYQSHFGMRLHFGLGPRDTIDRIETRWIGGGVDVVENVTVDRLITITEGKGTAGAQDQPAG
ncbi:MAG: CRTAC1 family protein, partial [Candidatus Krumholzibacteria bacterium]|nr:CRTAC1 family protein [Candidatus Krumholzibacteria bacterium]